MANHPEKENLDEHFRRAFEELPNAPSPTGWDTPSPRVWAGIEANLDPVPAPTSTTATWYLKLLVSVVSVVSIVAALVYFRPQPPVPAPATSTAKETPTATVVPAVPSQPAAVETRPAAASIDRTATPNTPSATTAAPSATVATPIVDTAKSLPPQVGNSARLPGTAPDAVPNTTERRRLEDLRNGPWRQPLPTLPTTRRAAPPRQ